MSRDLGRPTRLRTPSGQKHPPPSGLRPENTLLLQARNNLLLQFTTHQQASSSGLVPYLGGTVGVGGVEQLLDAQQELLNRDGGPPTLILKREKDSRDLMRAGRTRCHES